MRRWDAFHDAVNEQIGYEFAASQQYIAIAVYYDAETLPHLAAHFYRQAVEERNHAMMLVQFLLDADDPVTVPGVDRAEDRLRRRRRAGARRARSGEARHRADREPAQARPRRGRLRRRGVDALVPEGAARGGLVDERPAQARRARARVEHPARRGLRSPGRRSATRASIRRRRPRPAARSSYQLPGPSVELPDYAAASASRTCSVTASSSISAEVSSFEQLVGGQALALAPELAQQRAGARAARTTSSRTSRGRTAPAAPRTPTRARTR